MSIAEEIGKTLDNKKFSCGVSLDFQNTFDTVNQDVLAAKLQYFVLYHWSTSKLVSVLLRQQVTKVLVNDSISEAASIT